MSRAFQALKIGAVPLLFAAVAMGLATVHIAQERKAARAKSVAEHATQAQDPTQTAFARLKLQELAPAVKQGDFSAEVEMGRRLALGDGAKKDEAQAAAYLQSAINQLGAIGAHDKRAAAAATACRILAQYYRRGLPAAGISTNPSYSFDLLHKAASYFGDPAAQYELAKLLISGDGVSQNTRGGAQWLVKASRKNFAPAQAMLGEMLWRGNVLKRAPGEGLGLLALARRNASAQDKPWVSKMFETARAEAMPIEILEANAFIVQESGASPFNAPDGGYLDGDGVHGAASGAKGGAIAAEQNALKGNSPLVADGKTFARKEGEPAAGIIQMYRLWGVQGGSENGPSVRLAGVAN
jgi:uncharacterized protein